MAAMAPAHGALAANPPAYVADTIADPGRPPGDLAQDGERKPADVLAFAGVKPNQVVVDFFARGYYTRLLAKLVGPKGKVYALTPMIVAFPDLEALIAENKQRVRDGKPGVVNPVDPLLAIQNIAEYSNVTAMIDRKSTRLNSSH